MPAPTTRRTVLQKVRGPAYKAVPQLVNTGFQVLFHSPPGVLFTFPSQYYALSVTEEYLALGGGPPDFPQGSTCLAVLRILPACLSLRIRGFHPVSHDFPEHFCWVWQYLMQSITPVCQADWFRLFPFRSPLHRESLRFLFLCLLRCFSSAGVALYTYVFSIQW